MPKQKTLKSLTKRLRLKKKKVLRLHGAQRHLLAKKSSQKRRYRKDKREKIHTSDFKKIKKLI